MKQYALGIAMFVMFAGSWLGQWLTHDGDMMEFWNATFENWQSEAWQVFWFVVLAKYLLYVGSPQSRDGNDRMESKIDQILGKLK